MMFLYRYVFYPCFFLLAYSLRFLHPKLKLYFKLRKNPYKDVKIYKNAFWFHCSSGEIEYAKPIIRWLKQTYPNEKIVVTYFSNSSLKNIKSIAEVDMVLPLPFDTKKRTREFLLLLQPKFLFVARTDLWPEMLLQAKQAKITSVLFAATLSEENPKFTTTIGRYLFQKMLDTISLVICVSTEDKNRFESFQIRQLEVAADTRYIQVQERLKNKKALPCQIKTTKPLLVLGSTWTQDENKLIPAFIDILAEGFQIILVPHEVKKKHLKSIYEDLDYMCLSYAKWSKSTKWNSSDILVVDQVGYLAEIYGFAEVAFVGGSFKKQVHSVMEALASGCLTFVGPKHKNNREATRFQEIKIEGIEPVQVIQNGKHLVQLLRKWKQQNKSKKFKQGLITEMERLAMDAKTTFTIIQSLIEKTDA